MRAKHAHYRPFSLTISWSGEGERAARKWSVREGGS